MTERQADDLHGLLDWGDELHEATRQAERRPRRRRCAVSRIGLALALLVLVVPAAFAARSIWRAPQHVGTGALTAATPAVDLAAGRTGDVRWRLAGYDSGAGQVCSRLEAFRGARQIVDGRACANPRTRAALSVMPMVARGASFVVGTTAGPVRTVTVTAAAGDQAHVATIPLSPAAVRRSGLQAASRAYVAVFPRELTRATWTPEVAGYGADGTLIASTSPVSTR